MRCRLAIPDSGQLPACRTKTRRSDERAGYDYRQMERLNPRFVRRVLLPAGYLVFLFGALISAEIFFRSRPFDVKAAVLSDLQSPDDNPKGYAASAIGTAVFAILLAPATIVFHRRLLKQSPRLA